jgi:hypothetical protein
MALWHQLIERSPEAVWTVLADPTSYSRWVVGVSGSRMGRGRWPEVGAQLEYELPLGPWRMRGDTVVRRSEPPRALELEAHSPPLGTVRIAVELRPWGERECLAILDEHPLRGPAGSLHNAVLDAFIQLRHRTMLVRLARLVERVTPPVPSRPGA